MVVLCCAALPPQVRDAIRRHRSIRLNHSTFDVQRYCALRDALVAYTTKWLTTEALARYFLREIEAALGVREPRVLLVTPTDVEYQSGMLYHGLVTQLGSRLSSWLGRKPLLYADHRRDWGAYGRGLSYQGVLPTPEIFVKWGQRGAEMVLHKLMRQRLEAGVGRV